MDTQWILFWWAKNMVSQMTAWQEEAKRKHDEQLAKNSETEWQNLYLAWLNATDPKAQQQNFTGANAINVWKIIAQAAKDHWSNSYDWLEPNQAISRYMENNPDKMDITNKAIAWEIDLNTWANAIWAYIDDTDYTEWWLYESYAPVDTGKSSEETSWAWANILWWVMDTLYWIPKTLNKAWNYLAYGIDRLRWTDKERAKEVLEYNQNRVDNIYEKITPWDPDSKLRQWVALGTDLWATIASSFIPVAWEVKRAETLTKYPKLAALVKNSPKLMKALKRGWEWVKDTVLFNTLQWELTSPTEAWAWWLLNIAFWAGWNVLWKALDKFGLKWLMTTAKAKNVIKTIREEWGKTSDVDSLVKWFNERGFKWSADEILEQVNERVSKAKWLKDELLALSDNVYESPETTEILNALREKLNTPWLEEKLSKVDELLGKGWKYTLTDMESTLRLLDDSSLNPFQRDQFWKLLKSETSEWMANLRTKVKELIENEADNLWLGDIRWLNNEIVTSKKFAEWVSQKSITDQLKDWLAQYWPLATAWWIFWYIRDWDLAWALKYWLIWLAGKKLLKNTSFRTSISSAIQKLKWTEKVSLEKWLGSEWKQALTDKGSQILADILENSDDWIKQKVVEILLETMREWAVIWWAEWVDAIVWED